MRQIVTLSRALPLPPVQANGANINFVPVTSPDDIPAGALAHITTALDPVDANAIAAMPDSLGLIANIGVGVDNIDLAAAQARGILVSNTPVVTEDTADLTFALILAAARRTGNAERFVRDGAWGTGAAMPALGTRVHGKTLGLVGFGPIAQAVARRARGFGIAVQYWNRAQRPEAEADTGATYVAQLDDLLSTSNIVSVHAALVPQTRNLICADRIARLPKGAILVNTARGGIVDEKALCAALDSGNLAAVGLDVFETEPQIFPGLLTHENAVLTPHIGSATTECRGDMVRSVLSNVIAHLEGRAINNPVTLA